MCYLNTGTSIVFVKIFIPNIYLSYYYFIIPKMTSYLCLLSLLILTPTVISQTVVVTPLNTSINGFLTGDCTVNSGYTPVWSVSLSLENMVNNFVDLAELGIFQLSNSSTDVNETVSWRVQFQLRFAGIYRCQSTLNGTVVSNATVLVSGIVASDFERDIEAYRGMPKFEIVCRFTISAPPQLLPRAEWCYTPYVYPNLGDHCIPIANNSVIIPIESFPNFTAERIYEFSIEITDVLTTNAGLYQFVISIGSSNLPGAIRLRVRDQLDPLWPAIGIIIQLIIITIFIVTHFIWDYYKEKKNLEMRRKKEDQNTVTTPSENLVEDEQLSNQQLINVVPT